MSRDHATATTYHDRSIEETLAALRADATKGLDSEEAARRLAEVGPNRMTARRGTPAWRSFLDQFVQPLVVVLLLAALVSAALGDTVDALVISAVVLVNAVIGFLQEHRAERAISALDALVETRATVVRDGAPRHVPSHALVPGDLVLVASGDSAPADLRLVTVQDLQLEEAALTGESVPVVKAPGTLPPETALADRSNMVFAGTAVTYGKGRGVVTATGDATETGRIAGLLARTPALVTPLTRRIAALSKLLVWLILGAASVLFAAEALRGADLAETFNAAIALAVGAIPEGLPAAVTVLLAVGVQRLARRRALVRKLPAVETLGSTTVICSDKTGTLTENAMTVTRVWTRDARYRVSGVGYAPTGTFTPERGETSPTEDAALTWSLRTGALCNDSRVVRAGDEARVEGDPTEAALLVVAEKADWLDATHERQRLAEIPFESAHMYMATLHDAPDGTVLLAKGSPEVLIDRCGDALAGSGALAPVDRDEVHRAVERMAAEGLRVLCLARRSLAGSRDRIAPDDVRDLTLVGLVGMIDPPREAAKRSIAVCHGAGIRVKMITGDHAVTASAIAEQLGLQGARGEDGRLRAVTGRELEQIDPRQLPEVAHEVAVFARVAPEQKLLLVEALQRSGHVVAMTGDGVNDAPALKAADLGIAMGKGGTDVARGASAMILTDDNFETIGAAVEEGRCVYDNLVKFITWTLPTNGGEALVLLAAVILGTALPILPVQILWVNMTTALLLGVTLVVEPKERGLMERQPRPLSAPILDRRLGIRTLLVSALMATGAFGLFEWALTDGRHTTEQARTIAVNTIVVVEAAYLFACRSLRWPIWTLGPFSNPWVWLGATAMLLAQLAFTYVPVFNALFHTQPIEWTWWIGFTASGLVVLVAVETSKVLRLRRIAPQSARTPAS